MGTWGGETPSLQTPPPPKKSGCTPRILQCSTSSVPILRDAAPKPHTAPPLWGQPAGVPSLGGQRGVFCSPPRDKSRPLSADRGSRAKKTPNAFGA